MFQELKYYNKKKIFFKININDFHTKKYNKYRN